MCENGNSKQPNTVYVYSPTLMKIIFEHLIIKLVLCKFSASPWFYFSRHSIFLWGNL